jgi:hypothetical protein
MRVYVCGTRLVLVVRLLAIGLTELHQGKVCMRLGIDDGTGCMRIPRYHAGLWMMC